ncbi:MAG TPA: L,D-transpeptidase family protein [Flavisolibacter sp.]|nr:L,D-transpeptidase family protein [Flavisolibacter sp.]
MKYLIFYLSLALGLLTACNSDGEGGSNSSESAQEAKKGISTRDMSITAQNAYSSLFMDSSAVETYIQQKQLPDSIARRMRSFYNSRNFQYAWFTNDGLTEQARGFWSLHDYHTTYSHDTTLHDKSFEKKMANLTTEESLSVSVSDKSTQATELQLTQHFIHYMMSAYPDGYVKRKEMERFVPAKKQDALALADSLVKKKHKDDKYFEDLNEPYGRLKDQLARYVDVAAKGGWQPVQMEGKSLKKGASSPAIVQIKRTLHLMGDMPALDTTPVFNDTLEMAVMSFQERHGYKPDGVIGASFIKDLNVPAQTRVQQILINMDRMRWLPNTPSSDNLIVVNIPEYVLHMYEGKNKVWDMNVVVGKVGHNTMMFNGDLNQVVFSPYWNVPPSIVKNEILPAMDRNPNYIASQNMEVTGNSGGLPEVRQKPGQGNALGKVKFLFPNSFNIYFHDTPSKSLFDREKRAFSHGCIRLSDPTKMAEYLLRNQSEWTPEKIQEAMNAGTEKYVKLQKPVPVIITYYTAWVDDKGRMNFRDDIYKHDDKLAKKMFNTPAINNNAEAVAVAKTN